MYRSKWNLISPIYSKKLGNRGEDDMGDEGTDYYGGVFQNCRNLTGNLILPDNLELIRGYCFSGCSGLYGELRLPANLREWVIVHLALVLDSQAHYQYHKVLQHFHLKHFITVVLTEH